MFFSHSCALSCLVPLFVPLMFCSQENDIDLFVTSVVLPLDFALLENVREGVGYCNMGEGTGVGGRGERKPQKKKTRGRQIHVYIYICMYIYIYT